MRVAFITLYMLRFDILERNLLANVGEFFDFRERESIEGMPQIWSVWYKLRVWFHLVNFLLLFENWSLRNNVSVCCTFHVWSCQGCCWNRWYFLSISLRFWDSLLCSLGFFLWITKPHFSLLMSTIWSIYLLICREHLCSWVICISHVSFLYGSWWIIEQLRRNCSSLCNSLFSVF